MEVVNFLFRMWYQNNRVAPGQRPPDGAKEIPRHPNRRRKTALGLLNETIFEPFIFVDRCHSDSPAGVKPMRNYILLTIPAKEKNVNFLLAGKSITGEIIHLFFPFSQEIRLFL